MYFFRTHIMLFQIYRRGKSLDPLQIQCCQHQVSSNPSRCLVRLELDVLWHLSLFQLDIVFGNPMIFLADSPSFENHGLCVFVGLTHNLDEDWAWDRTLLQSPEVLCSTPVGPLARFQCIFSNYEFTHSGNHWVMEAESIFAVRRGISNLIVPVTKDLTIKQVASLSTAFCFLM